MHLIRYSLLVFGCLVIVACAEDEEQVLNGESDLLVEAVVSPDPRLEAALLFDIEVDFQEALIGCMRARGFEYYSTEQRESAEMGRLFAFFDALEGDDGVFSLLPSVSEARDRGFGVSLVLQQLSSGVGVGAVDRNVEYVEALSADAQRAYANALGAGGNNGCQARAEQDVGIVGIFETLDSAAARSQRVDDVLQFDVEVFDKVAAWMSCLVEAGVDEPIVDPFVFAESTRSRLVDSVQSNTLSTADAIDADIEMALLSSRCGGGAEYEQWLQRRRVVIDDELGE